MMGFRIRDVEEDFESQDVVYRDHLEKFNKKNNGDLWRYFYWDFFHDGIISSIFFKKGMGEVEFLMSCPNIKKKKGNDFEYVNVDFKCTFTNVAYFLFDNKDSVNDYEENFTFLYAEVNSLKKIIEEKQLKYDEDFCSLIIEVIGGVESSFIEMVFSGVHVEAIENTAFELMLESESFKVPIYEKDSDK